MITLVKEPNEYAGVMNPVWIKATTDNMWQTTGVKAVYSFAVAVGTIVATDYIEFVIGGVAYRWTFVAGTAGDEEITLTGLTGPIIVAEMIKTRFIGNNYSLLWVPGTPDLIVVTAKDYGAEWNMTVNYNGTPFGTQSPAGVDWVRKDGFRLLMDVFLTGTDAPIGTYEPVPDTDYTTVWANFYIENVLKPYLRSQPPKAGNTALMTTANTVRKYTAKMYEKTIGATKVNYYNELPVTERWAYNGGTDWDKWPRDKGALSTDYFSVNAARKFLSRKPKNSYIYRNEQQYVYWWCEKGGTNDSLNAQWTVYYKDGTNEVETLVYAAVENEVAIVPAWLDAITGLAQSRDNIIRAKLVLSYNQSSGGAVYSETWLWDVMPDTPYKKNIQLKNSLGGYDSWMMTGGAEQGKQTESIVSSAPIADGYFDTPATPYAAVMGTDTGQRIEQNKILKLNSGWLNKAHAEWMVNELGSSLLILDGTLWVEWRITDKSVGSVKDDADMQEVVVVVVEAFVSNRG